MRRGVEQFLTQRRRDAESIAAISIAVSLVFYAAISVPAMLLQTPLAPKIRPLMRFGFEGPERIVRTIHLIGSFGPAEALENVGSVVTVPSTGSAGGPSVPSQTSRAPAQGSGRLPGFGEGALSLVQRALASEGRTPIFQSEELVIEHLVKPVYPEDARNRGIEGRVAVIARVDTLGLVAEVEVMTGSGAAMLDRAATEAVSKCRFRPYRVDGKTREVYAVFRFAFRIY